MKNLLRRIARGVRFLGTSIAKGLRFWPEGLHVTWILVGWASITFGVATLLTWQVWPISLGLFAFSMAGWGHLRLLFGKGLYALSADWKKRSANRG